jgi:hypothetical protein
MLLDARTPIKSCADGCRKCSVPVGHCLRSAAPVSEAVLFLLRRDISMNGEDTYSVEVLGMVALCSWILGICFGALIMNCVRRDGEEDARPLDWAEEEQHSQH